MSDILHMYTYTVSAKSIRKEKIFFLCTNTFFSKKTLFLKNTINIIQREMNHRIDIESI